MTLYIDGKSIDPKPGSSLLALLRELGMDASNLSQRPLAAKIAGEAHFDYFTTTLSISPHKK